MDLHSEYMNYVFPVEASYVNESWEHSIRMMFINTDVCDDIIVFAANIFANGVVHKLPGKFSSYDHGENKIYSLNRIGLSWGAQWSLRDGWSNLPKRTEDYFLNGRKLFHSHLYDVAFHLSVNHKTKKNNDMKMPYDEYIKTEAYKQNMIRKKLWDFKNDMPIGGWKTI